MYSDTINMRLILIIHIYFLEIICYLLKKKINKNMQINIGKLMGISGSRMHFINPWSTNNLPIKQGENSISNGNLRLL